MMSYEERLAHANAAHDAGLERVATTPPPPGQKYLPGTRVWIAKDLGPFMSHFPAGRWARVKYTYAHAYGGPDAHRYTLELEGGGSSAWYYESQLSLEEES